jgi:hypothetical protein
MVLLLFCSLLLTHIFTPNAHLIKGIEVGFIEDGLVVVL